MATEVNMKINQEALDTFLKENPDAIPVTPMDKNIGDRIFMAEGTPSCSGETSTASMETLLGNKSPRKTDD